MQDNNFAYQKTQAAENAAVDAGLRSYMLRVYNLMALAVAFTGVVSFLTLSSPALFQLTLDLRIVLLFGLLGLGWFAPRLIFSQNTALAQFAFWGYAAGWGLLMAPLFAIYTETSIVRAFMITSGAFAGVSLYGYTTKRNLQGWGVFLGMASIGVLIAVLVNAFLLQSSGFQLLLSVGIVLLFSAMTAYETQAIKRSYSQLDSASDANKKAIFGAFLLYGSFVTMFVWILSIVGIARE